VTEKLRIQELNKIEYAAEEAVIELEDKGYVSYESDVVRNFVLEVTPERVQALLDELRDIAKERPFRTHLTNRKIIEIEIAVNNTRNVLSAPQTLSGCIKASEILAQEVTPNLALTLVEEVRQHREGDNYG